MSIVKIKTALEQQLDAVAPIIAASSITSVVHGAIAVFTTALPHGLISGLLVKLTACASVPDGIYLVVVTGDSTFTLQNNATQAAISATIDAISGSVQAYLNAWPNVSFQSPIGVPYQEIALITAAPEELTQGGGYYKEQGIFQVTLVYPLGVGAGAALTRAELIRSSFKKGLSLLYQGVTVIIPKTPAFGAAYGENDSFRMPVKIPFSADVFV